MKSCIIVLQSTLTSKFEKKNNPQFFFVKSAFIEILNLCAMFYIWCLKRGKNKLKRNASTKQKGKTKPDQVYEKLLRRF